MVTFITIAMIALGLLAVWVVFRQGRAWKRTLRGGGGAFEPVVDPNPPKPVVKTGGVTALSAAALVWAGLHCAAIGFWAVTGWLVARDLRTVLVAVYLAAAATVTTVGGVLLLRGERYGRRALGIGQFLFALAAFMGIVMAILLPRGQDIPSQWFTVANWAAGGMAGHLVIDTALGAAAQHVGTPAES